ncbi:MAG TPA: acyl carrier protein [Allosphingosinicella sp.]|nr:acyl carrier protein [Allosphingosinicella sp.]
MKGDIINIIADYLDIPKEELAEYKTLEDLNVDSLDFAEIMFEIEEKYDVEITFEMQGHKDEIGNLGDVLRLIEELIVKHRASAPVENSE